MFLSPPLHTRTCIGVLWSIIGCFIHSLLWNAFTLFFTVNSSVNAAWSSFNSVCPRKVPQGYVGAILNKLTAGSIALNEPIQLVGYPKQRHDPLSDRSINLLIWTLTMALYAIHKSAKECRFGNTNLSPLTIFKALVKAHLKYQYKLYKFRHTQFYFPYDWCIGDALAKISNNTFVLPCDIEQLIPIPQLTMMYTKPCWQYTKVEITKGYENKPCK